MKFETFRKWWFAKLEKPHLKPRMKAEILGELFLWDNHYRRLEQ